MLNVGDRLPDVLVWTSPRAQVTLAELAAEQPALFFFYLFDWSST